MGGGGWKRVVLGGNKKKFGQKQGFWFVKMGIFCGQFVSFLQKKGIWYVKMGFFCGQRRKVRAKEFFVRKNGFE